MYTSVDRKELCEHYYHGEGSRSSLLSSTVDVVFTEVSIDFQGVFDVDPNRGLILKEIADGVSLQEIVESTGCEFEVRSTKNTTFCPVFNRNSLFS